MVDNIIMNKNMGWNECSISLLVCSLLWWYSFSHLFEILIILWKNFFDFFSFLYCVNCRVQTYISVSSCLHPVAASPSVIWISFRCTQIAYAANWLDSIMAFGLLPDLLNVFIVFHLAFNYGCLHFGKCTSFRSNTWGMRSYMRRRHISSFLMSLLSPKNY